MPEILTKYPESALYVLKSAGAQCGVGMEQHILKKCPPSDFCHLPQGEICIYDIKNITKMTQINPTDMADFVSHVPSIYSNVNIILLMISCLFGMIVGMFLNRK